MMTPPVTSVSSSAPARSGSALMVMIWAVLMMSVTVMGVVEYMSYAADEGILNNAEFRALYMAECGLAVGLHPSARRGDIVLKQKIGTDSGFDVVINYEGARIPANFMTDDRLREAVYTLFVRWGLNGDQAAIAVDALSDWQDTDDEPRANGAESDFYKLHGIYSAPGQRGFINVDEMLQVRGMNVVDRLKPDWRDYFSVYGDGTIDLRTAFRDTLLAVTGSSETDVDRFVRERDGADGIPGTEDDKRISDNESFRLLGLEGDRAAELKATLTSDDRVRRITSTGYVGEKRAQIVVIARRGDDRSLTYLARIEE